MIDLIQCFFQIKYISFKKCVSSVPKQVDRELNRLCHHIGALSHAWYTLSFLFLPVLGYQKKVWKNWDHIEKAFYEGTGTFVSFLH